jgi:hypothetical protein
MPASIINNLKEQYKKLRWRRKLKQLDREYYHSLFRDQRPYPPSFYLTHTEEEIKQKMEEDYQTALSLIEELED